MTKPSDLAMNKLEELVAITPLPMCSLCEPYSANCVSKDYKIKGKYVCADCYFNAVADVLKTSEIVDAHSIVSYSKQK